MNPTNSTIEIPTVLKNALDQLAIIKKEVVNHCEQSPMNDILNDDAIYVEDTLDEVACRIGDIIKSEVTSKYYFKI